MRNENMYNNEEKTAKQRISEVLAKTFLKQCLAVAVLIIGILLINRSAFEFGKNCVAALSRAVRYDFDWGGVFDGIRNYASGVWRFWSEIF